MLFSVSDHVEGKDVIDITYESLNGENLHFYSDNLCNHSSYDTPF